MGHDKFQHDGDEHSQTGERPHEAVVQITIDATDPVIANRRQGRGQKPDQQQPDEDDQKLEDDGDRDKRHGNSQDRQQDQNGQGKNRGVQQAREHDHDRSRDQEDRVDDRSRRQQPSMMKNLLITAGVSLVCGVIGAMGYAHFFGPKSEGSSSDQAQGESDSGSKNESGSKEKSTGGEGKESGKESNSRALTTNSIPGVSLTKDADMLEQQIKDLSRRVNNLRERVDGVTQPTDATPPALRTMQVKMSKLAHEMAEVSAVPAAFRHYDKRLETLKEELKTLRARIGPAQADSTGGRIPSLTPLAGIAAPASPTGGSKASKPTDQGASRPER